MLEQKEEDPGVAEANFGFMPFGRHPGSSCSGMAFASCVSSVLHSGDSTCSTPAKAKEGGAAGRISLGENLLAKVRAAPAAQEEDFAAGQLAGKGIKAPLLTRQPSSVGSTCSSAVGGHASSTGLSTSTASSGISLNASTSLCLQARASALLSAFEHSSPPSVLALPAYGDQLRQQAERGWNQLCLQANMPSEAGTSSGSSSRPLVGISAATPHQPARARQPPMLQCGAHSAEEQPAGRVQSSLGRGADTLAAGGVVEKAGVSRAAARSPLLELQRRLAAGKRPLCTRSAEDGMVGTRAAEEASVTATPQHQQAAQRPSRPSIPEQVPQQVPATPPTISSEACLHLIEVQPAPQLVPEELACIAAEPLELGIEEHALEVDLLECRRRQAERRRRQLAELCAVDAAQREWRREKELWIQNARAGPCRVAESEGSLQERELAAGPEDASCIRCSSPGVGVGPKKAPDAPPEPLQQQRLPTPPMQPMQPVAPPGPRPPGGAPGRTGRSWFRR